MSEFFLDNGEARAPEIRYGVPAHSARLLEWDGRNGIVEHDGTCYLIVRRAAYPGWLYRIDDGPWRPVLKANGNLQCVPVPVREEGSATEPRKSRIELVYRPTGLTMAAAVSLLATAAALGCLLLGSRRLGVPTSAKRNDPAGIHLPQNQCAGLMLPGSLSRLTWFAGSTWATKRDSLQAKWGIARFR